MSNHSQFALLGERRFAPFFATQFLGAFNDNVYKNALLLLVTFHLPAFADQAPLLVNLGAGLFILPFFLFSAIAGQLADRYDKALLIRRVKLAEVIIMVLAAVALLTQSVPVLFALLFAMGAQSAFFGPAKFAILPQILARDELVGGNALVEMGTFLAILLGTLLGGWLLEASGGGEWVAAVVVALAIAGYGCARAIPAAPAPQPELEVSFSWWRENVRLMVYARETESVFLSIMGASWFWFYGSLLLAQVPAYTRDVLAADGSVATLILAAFSVGVGLGSLACERFSLGRVELGLVPIGALGMTVFGLHLGFAPAVEATGALQGWREFLGTGHGWRVLADIALIAFSGGLYIVPLMAFIQQRTPEARRARVIAANNVLNAVFMVAAALIGAWLLYMGLSVPWLFVVVAVMNAAVSAFIFTKVPEFVLRFITWIVVTLMYRVRVHGIERIPEEGAAVVTCNHVSYVDALMLMAIIRRPIRFVMHKSIWKWPVLGFAFRVSGAVPIASAKDDPQMMEAAFDKVAAYLREGELVGIFPEGAITRDGELLPFRPGIERIIETTPAPVVPMALSGLWGSFFSHAGKGPFKGAFKRMFSRIDARVGEPIEPDHLSAAKLEAEVLELRGDVR